jgi:hypothetical protein
MADAHLAYDPKTGHLVYDPATGHLALGCGGDGCWPCRGKGCCTTYTVTYTPYAGGIPQPQQVETFQWLPSSNTQCPCIWASTVYGCDTGIAFTAGMRQWEPTYSHGAPTGTYYQMSLAFIGGAAANNIFCAKSYKSDQVTDNTGSCNFGNCTSWNHSNPDPCCPSKYVADWAFYYWGDDGQWHKYVGGEPDFPGTIDDIQPGNCPS